MSSLESKIIELDNIIKNLKNKISDLELRVNFLERRNNSITGIPITRINPVDISKFDFKETFKNI